MESSTRSTLFKLFGTAVGIGISVYSGGALAPFAAYLFGAAHSETIVAEAEKFFNDVASHLLSGLVEDWSDAKGRHVVNAIHHAIAACMDAAARQSEGTEREYLLDFARQLRQGKLRPQTGSSPARLDALDIPAFLGGQKNLSGDEWTQLLLAFAPEAPQSSRLVLLDLDDRKKTALLKSASAVLETRFSHELREAYRKLGPEDNQAWQDLLLRFLTQLQNSVANMQSGIQGLGEHLSLMSKQLAEVQANASQPPFEQFLHHLQEKLTVIQQSALLIQSGHIRLESTIQVPSDAPVIQLPFHYSLQDTVLTGSQALHMKEHGFQLFLEDKREMCWWLWTGLEGAGKSRLAREVCGSAIAQGWKAGFVSQQRLRNLAHRWDTCIIEGNVLLVFDYAGDDPELVRAALYELAKCAAPARDQSLHGPRWRVRALLLERHVAALSPADLHTTLPLWYLKLLQLGAGHNDTETILQAQYPAPGAKSFHLGLLDRETARALAEQYLKRLDDTSRTAPGTKEALSEEERKNIAESALTKVDGITRPLHIMIAARVLRDIKGQDLADFDEVMYAWLEYRVERRREKLAEEYNKEEPGAADRLLNLLCLATVLGELPLDKVPEHELLPSRRFLAEHPGFLRFFEQDSGNNFLKKLEPDLVGEWFVLYRTELQEGSRFTPAVLAQVLEKCADFKSGLAPFVQRTYRCFHEKQIPGGKKSTLWRVLSGTLGRYATAFGKVFDHNLAGLLKGTTREAEEYYSGLVIENIQAAIEEGDGRIPLVVDLMAGGSDRPQQLLDRFGSQIMLLVIDSDDSRLKTICPPNKRLFCAKIVRVDESFRLSQILEECFSQPTCDVVIAKKALHELPWKAQQHLIAEISACLPSRGSMVLYADSPDFMDNRFIHEWRRQDHWLKELLKINGADDSAEARHELFPPQLQFDASNLSAPAMFMNCWIKLKDWANYNVSEYENRYFSSCNQLQDEFRKAGFEACRKPERFYMDIQATRFVEEAINRLGYLSVNQSISHENLLQLFQENHRYRLFWDFGQAHLYHNGHPSELGKLLKVKMAAMSLKELLPEDFHRQYGPANLPVLSGPSFQMPIHVFEFHKP